MTESRNLNSGVLHTSFVEVDFTVAKIITQFYQQVIEPNYYTLSTAKIEEKQPVFKDDTTVWVLYPWRVAERRLRAAFEGLLRIAEPFSGKDPVGTLYFPSCERSKCSHCPQSSTRYTHRFPL